ncbi:uncharacterized protein BJ212DRAFT_1537129 [Suillus subaureus]|uniref:Uncharacterized protein n=1 Tax=Suillus subaureus TaxID=48587 RepID=A0A9P7J7Z0_9AGAM|nr:uncharacterized protein BJ212DRAFT_1537129 [Suillus subaureus]KAG1807322.1 hypothetical protein BJ212DRAFT_1537129 [Suillus subaureus]
MTHASLVCCRWQPGDVAILKVLHLWMISNSIKFTIDGLENLTLQPTHRLELAQLYSIPQWIAPAIHKIILLSLVNTTNTEAAQMGWCKEAWSGFWWKKVAHVILHPTNPLPLAQTLQLIIEAPLPDELDGLEVKERIIEGVIRAVTLYFSSL